MHIRNILLIGAVVFLTACSQEQALHEEIVERWDLNPTEVTLMNRCIEATGSAKFPFRDAKSQIIGCGCTVGKLVDSTSQETASDHVLMLEYRADFLTSSTNLSKRNISKKIEDKFGSRELIDAVWKHINAQFDYCRKNALNYTAIASLKSLK